MKKSQKTFVCVKCKRKEKTESARPRGWKTIDDALYCKECFDANFISGSLSFEVYVSRKDDSDESKAESKEVEKRCLDSIRLYRAVCRKVFAAILLAETAGAKISMTKKDIRLRTNSANAKIALATALGFSAVEGKVKGDRGEGTKFSVQVKGGDTSYALTEIFKEVWWPAAETFVWDSIRRDVSTVWSSPDPEHPKASRGWLAVQGARDVAKFNWRGIGFPVATATKTQLLKHKIVLCWDKNIGPVEFAIPKMDPGRYMIWRNLRDRTPGWNRGTVFLHERDGQLKVSISYSRPVKHAMLDAGRELRVKFDQNSMVLSGPEGERTYKRYDFAEIKAFLQSMKRQREWYEARKEACGKSGRKQWGFKKGRDQAQDRLTRITRKRELGQHDRNHCLTRKIIMLAVSWRCGIIAVEQWPIDYNGNGLLCGEPWAWSDWMKKLQYKAKDIGAQVIRPPSDGDNQMAQANLLL